MGGGCQQSLGKKNSLKLQGRYIKIQNYKFPCRLVRKHLRIIFKYLSLFKELFKVRPSIWLYCCAFGRFLCREIIAGLTLSEWPLQNNENSPLHPQPLYPSGGSEGLPKTVCLRSFISILCRMDDCLPLAYETISWVPLRWSGGNINREASTKGQAGAALLIPDKL